MMMMHLQAIDIKATDGVGITTPTLLEKKEETKRFLENWSKTR